jgi:hypothetical protein
MPTLASSPRRPYIYPHRSARMLPRVRRRLAGGLAASTALTFVLWHYLDSLVIVHNAVALRLLTLAGVRDVQLIDTTVLQRTVPVLVTRPSPGTPWVGYGAAVVIAAALIVLAVRTPLARGIATFVLAILGLSTLAHRLGAPGLREFVTFPVVWTHTELLVWLVLPSMAALLFITIQPSWARGIAWMVAIEAFAVLWSAARLVVVLGSAQMFGSVLLPTLWFVWGPLADVLYLTTFFSMAVHVNLRLTPERRR